MFWTSEKDITSVVREWEEFWGMKIGSEMIDLYIAKSDNDRILVNDGVLIEAKGDDLVHHQLSNLKNSEQNLGLLIKLFYKNF